MNTNNTVKPFVRPLYNREDARRVLKTVAHVQAISLPLEGTRRMQALPANVLVGYANARGKRTVKLDTVKNNVVVFRYAAGR